MAAPEPAIFRALPGLRGLPWLPCLAGATSVEPLQLSPAPHEGLWVKRDDRSGVQVGGNKPRKLEWLLGAALARGARRVVTTGGLGTNHGIATTVLARQAGIATTLVLVQQPVTRAVQRALLLDAAWGAELVWGRNVPGAAAQVLRVLARSALRGERPQLVATGGSSRRGHLGFVSAAFELAEQVRAGECPEPSEIYVPVGSGGTLIGLVAGLSLAELSSRVVGVLVTDILPPSSASLGRRARRLLRWIGRREPGMGGAEPAPFEIATRQRGPGYGTPTPEAERALELAAGAGLGLETTYTAKCLAEILARSREGTLPPGPVLFWNTFNSRDLEAGAPRPLDPALLPARFRRFLAGRDSGRPE